MYACKSGKHWWIDEADAQKCCNGWHRELRIAQPGVPLPVGASVTVAGATLVGYVWARDEQRTQTGEATE